MLAQIPSIMLGWISQCVQVRAVGFGVALTRLLRSSGSAVGIVNPASNCRDISKSSGVMTIMIVSSSSASTYSTTPLRSKRCQPILAFSFSSGSRVAPYSLSSSSCETSCFVRTRLPQLLLLGSLSTTNRGRQTLPASVKILNRDLVCHESG